MAAGGLHPVVQELADRYPRCRTTKDKMVAIDGLIHRFHHELENRWRNASGWNLIEGKEEEVVGFLREPTGTTRLPRSSPTVIGYLEGLDVQGEQTRSPECGNWRAVLTRQP